MKKGKIAMTIIIGAMCLILSMVMFIQFKTISQIDITALETMREDELKAEVTSLKAKYEEVAQEIEDTETKIAEYKQIISTGQEASELLNSELAETQNLLGVNDVTGPGIIITLTDTEQARVNSSDLLTLINLLKTAGAEAISINDQRIVYDSYIADINSTIISVNGEKRIVSPYVVKVIGNTLYLESAISQKQYGFVDTKISEGKIVTIEKQENMFINKSTKDLSFEYVKEDN